MESAQSASTAAVTQPIPFLKALRFWLKLGFISFGGPAGQIAVMHRELVERRRWISDGRFLHALNYCMILPGPEATQLAVYIGWLMHGTLGGIIAGTLFVLPGALLLTALSWSYIAFGKVPLVAGVLYGFKAAVIALIVAALLRIGRKAIRSVALALIALAALAVTLWTPLPFPALLLGAGLLGFLIERLAPGVLEKPKLSAPEIHSADSAQGIHSAESAQPVEKCVIDDHSPTPPHARVSATKLMATAAVFAILLGAPLLALSVWRGYDDVFARMSRFFLLAAFVTVGGAYAVLPYVTEMSTRVYGWLAPGQMIDGLALGETTPGPLILVLTFVGYVGAWNVEHQRYGVWGALAGALIATYFTFVPSFMFILLGGPGVEQTRGELRLGAIMTTITAAIVGVICEMAILFSQHVFFPAGLKSFDVAALVITAAAFAALQWKKADVVLVVMGCGVSGALWQALRG
ncbi:MAG TPA: chromate efflux transporter [Planctomycetota bacterium]|nr:chromate efflux transporter [Planctomycetota bacterium]